MKILLLLLVLTFTGCSAFSVPHSTEPPPIQINKHIVLEVNIDKDLTEFGIEGKTASACKLGGLCVLYLPKLKHPMDSRGWCRYGVMLGRAIFGPRDNEGMECAAY